MKSWLIPLAIERARDILAKPAGGGLTIHNIELVDRRTSFRLDRTIWRALQDIALRERITVDELCTAIDVQKPRALSLTVAVRIAVLQYYRDAATEAGHQQAGHGEALRCRHPLPFPALPRPLLNYAARKSPASWTRLFPRSTFCAA